MVADGTLGNFPGCGSTQPEDSNQQPWLGALYALPLDPATETEARFVVPVALLSAKTKLQPNWPTIIVATGDIFDTKIVNSSSSTVSSEVLASWVSALDSCAYSQSSFISIGKWNNNNTGDEIGSAVCFGESVGPHCASGILLNLDSSLISS